MTRFGTPQKWVRVLHTGRGDVLSRTRIMVCVALIACMAVVATDVLTGGPLTRFDHVVHDQLSQHYRDWLWWTCYYLQQTGNEYVLVPALGILSLVAAARFRSLRPMVVVFVLCVTLAVVVPGIKIVTGRTSPHSGVDVTLTSGTEFPSGHAVNAIVLWGAILELLVVVSPTVQRWLSRRVRTAVVVFTGLTAGGGALGLSYHWLTDVLAGWLLGSAMLIAFVGLDVFAELRRPRPPGPTPALEPPRVRPATSTR